MASSSGSSGSRPSSLRAPTLPDRPGSAPPPAKPPRTATARVHSPAPSSVRLRDSEPVTEDILIYENERRDESGFFSNSPLLPSDPPHWADPRGQLAAPPDEFKLKPGLEWASRWASDAKWQYSDKFSGNNWTDNPEGCSVRRRRWLRKYRKIAPRNENTAKSLGSPPVASRKQTAKQDACSPLEAFHKLIDGEGGRIDREKVEICARLVDAADPPAAEKQELIVRQLSTILDQIDHDSARIECLQTLSPILAGANIPPDICRDVLRSKLRYFSYRQKAAAILGCYLVPGQ